MTDPLTVFILQKLGEFRWLTNDQLDLMYPQRGIKTVNRRLASLAELGWVKPIGKRQVHKRVHTLTGQGKRALLRLGLKPKHWTANDARREMGSGKLQHEVLINEITARVVAACLARGYGTSVTHEPELERIGYFIPDKHIEVRRGSRIDDLFLEADGITLRKHHYVEKLENAAQFVRSEDYYDLFRQPRGQKRRTPYFLIVTAGTERRAWEIHRWVHPALGEVGKWRITSLQKLAPVRLLYQPIWRTPGQESLVPLFPS